MYPEAQLRSNKWVEHNLNKVLKNHQICQKKMGGNEEKHLAQLALNPLLYYYLTDLSEIRKTEFRVPDRPPSSLIFCLLFRCFSAMDLRGRKSITFETNLSQLTIFSLWKSRILAKDSEKTFERNETGQFHCTIRRGIYSTQSVSPWTTSHWSGKGSNHLIPWCDIFFKT